MKPMRFAATALVMLALTAPTHAAGPAPLAPGKPAGVKEAALGAASLPFIAILGFAGLAALLASTVGDGETANSTSTTGTP